MLPVHGAASQRQAQLPVALAAQAWALRPEIGSHRQLNKFRTTANELLHPIKFHET